MFPKLLKKQSKKAHPTHKKDIIFQQKKATVKQKNNYFETSSKNQFKMKINSLNCLKSTKSGNHQFFKTYHNNTTKKANKNLPDNHW